MEPNKDKPKKKQLLFSPKNISKIVVPGVIVLGLLLVGGMLWMAVHGGSIKKMNREQVVSMVKLQPPPPPPPEIKEKPPEPEVKPEEKDILIKKDTFTEAPTKTDMPDKMDKAPGDDTGKSSDDLLGVDSDSTGSDGFGLKAKRGGIPYLGSSGGGGGTGNGYGRFLWYTTLVQKEINDVVGVFIEKGGGIPPGDLKALISIEIDDKGRIVKYKILKSSGEQRMDSAIMKALSEVEFSKVPPPEMPRKMEFKITRSTTKGKA